MHSLQTTREHSIARQSDVRNTRDNADVLPSCVLLVTSSPRFDLTQFA